MAGPIIDFGLSAGGGGTVTSVALSLPATFSVSGSPITDHGTISASYASQSANLVFAGPSTGSASAPTFRALVAADLPALSYVTSVGLSLPATFSVSGSPVTSSGTLTASYATQSANRIFAGPSTGSAAAPAFRALVSADLPTISTANFASAAVSQWTNDSGYLTAVTSHNLLSTTHGDTSAAAVVRGDLIIGNSTPAWSRLAVGSANRVLSSDGTDVSWAAATGTGNVVRATSPTLTTPALGVATGTTLTLSPSGATGLTITGATETTSQPILSLTQTWNASGTVFSAFVINVANAASANGSLLMDVQQGGTSVWKVDRRGIYTFTVPSAGAGSLVLDGTANSSNVYSLSANNSALLGFGAFAGATWFVIKSEFGMSNNPTNTAPDLIFTRAGAAQLQLGKDTNGAAVSQTFSACNGITGTDKTGGNLTIASGKGTGAGAVSSLIFQTPTVGSTGTTAQSLATRLTIDSSGLWFGTHTGIGAETVTGYITIKDSGGTSRKLAVVS